MIGHDGTIYVGVNNSLCAITPDGKTKWQRGTERLLDTSPVVLADNTVCFVAHEGLVCDVDPEMNLMWTYYVYGYGYGSVAVGATGTLYLPDGGKGEFGVGFSAMRLNVPLARTPWPKFRGNARNTGNIQDSAQ